RDLPFMSVHAGGETRIVEQGSLVRLELERRHLTSFRLEHDLDFDITLWRYARRVAFKLRRFRPDVLHFTGPSDIGQLVGYLGHRLSIPMVGSWHTNLHEYATQRVRLSWMPDPLRRLTHRTLERSILHACMLFYRIPQIVLAPNEELLTLLEQGTR